MYIRIEFWKIGSIIVVIGFFYWSSFDNYDFNKYDFDLWKIWFFFKYDGSVLELVIYYFLILIYIVMFFMYVIISIFMI